MQPRDPDPEVDPRYRCCLHVALAAVDPSRDQVMTVQPETRTDYPNRALLVSRIVSTERRRPRSADMARRTDCEL
jgi:hypothetical protein